MIHNLVQKLTFAGPQRACNILKTSPALMLHVILNLIHYTAYTLSFLLFFTVLCLMFLYLYHHFIFPIVFCVHLFSCLWIKYCRVLFLLLVCLPSAVCVFVHLVCILFSIFLLCVHSIFLLLY